MCLNRVGTFGIDSNVFSSNYKAPSNDDHIGVAMIHVDKKLAKKKAALKSLPEQSRLTLLSGYEICHAFGAAERDAQ